MQGKLNCKLISKSLSSLVPLFGKYLKGGSSLVEENNSGDRLLAVSLLTALAMDIKIKKSIKPSSKRRLVPELTKYCHRV